MVRVTSPFGVSHLPALRGPAASTWVTNLDFLVHLPEHVVQVSPFRWLDKLRASHRPQAVLSICRPQHWWGR